MKNSCFHAEGAKTRATLSVCLIVRDEEREQLSGVFNEIKKQLRENGFTALRELDGILWSVLNH